MMKIQSGCISDKEIMSPTDSKLGMPKALLWFPVGCPCHAGTKKEMCAFPVMMS